MKLARLRPVHGFCAETAGAFTIFLATTLDIPISTTQTIAGSIVGVSSVSNPKAVRWRFAIQFIYAWILTIPAAALVSALCFWVIKIISASF